MNFLNGTSKAALLAASLSLAFTAPYAAASVLVAQANTEASSTSSSSPSGQSTSERSSSEQNTSGESTSEQSTSGQDASGQSSADTSGAGGGKGGGQSSAPIYMLIPLDVAAKDNAMKNGCWAKIYDRENYLGDSLTLVGPTGLSDMSGPFGLDWDDKVNSIQTGPNATVTVYDNPNFLDQVSQFKPGQRVPDLSKRMGFFDEFGSITLACKQG